MGRHQTFREYFAVAPMIDVVTSKHSVIVGVGKGESTIALFTDATKAQWLVDIIKDFMCEEGTVAVKPMAYDKTHHALLFNHGEIGESLYGVFMTLALKDAEKMLVATKASGKILPGGDERIANKIRGLHLER